ncbi:MAG: magnesium transporter [Anaerolineae bacterium]|nr:magnesium transporter [Anaerolineae bacterium]
MQTIYLDDVLARLRASLEQDDFAGAAAIIEELRPVDQADLFTELDEEDQVSLFSQLNPASSADLLEELEDEEAAELMAALPAAAAARIVAEMEPDEAVDMFGEMEPHQVQAVLSQLADPDEIRPLLLHPEDSAGGLMTVWILALRRRMTVAHALDAIREWQPEDKEIIQYLFVVDKEGKLCGVVSLFKLITSAPQQLVMDVMNPEVISVSVGTDQEECARIMSRYDLLTLPVVDEQGMLLGAITIDDVIDVLEEEATEDIQRFGGASPLDHSYLNTGVAEIARKRIGWLLMLFLTGTLTGTVMRLFEDELMAVVTLSIFIPLLIGTGGNAGSQTTSTIIRALAVGDLEWQDALKAFWHELRTGLILGAGMATVAYLRAVTWGTGVPVALTVALAIMAIVVWANSLGALLPLAAAKLRIDPTVVSGPAMSTLVDATGLFIYFTIARWILGL